MLKSVLASNESVSVSESYIDNGILSTRIDFMEGAYINDLEAVSKAERFFYTNGNVLSKHYINDRLCVISMSKSGVSA